MAVVLEGGCRVSTMHEGVPHVSGSLRVWNQVGRANGADAISLRVLEFGPGTSPELHDPEYDDVLYLLALKQPKPTNEVCVCVCVGLDVSELRAHC